MKIGSLSTDSDMLLGSCCLHLLFADDMVLFFKAVIVKEVLADYTSSTRQLINPSKCSITFGQSSQAKMQNEIKHTKEHETSADHVLNMTIRYELRSRLENDQAIDKTAQRQLEKEKDHLRKVLFRIVCIVKFLAKHSLAFRDTNSKLYEDSNGNFLGLIEFYQMESIAIEIGLSIVRNSVEYFVSVVNYLQKDIERAN